MKNSEKAQPAPRKSAKAQKGMKVKTQVKASGPVLQHNEKLVRR